ncbi:hypothetical protein HDV03_002668 [Kappamyces sp. JEL0829]|nr:hypothetical protein HDV03_002668 [Kappamyces sp. JEL0829]
MGTKRREKGSSCEDFTFEIASISFSLEIFKKSFETQTLEFDIWSDFTHEKLELCIKNPTVLENNHFISLLFLAILSHFPRRKKLCDANWPYLVRRIVDVNLDDFGQKNPLVVKESEVVDGSDLATHPYFSLKLADRVKILYFMACVWMMETEPIHKIIDASCKGIKKNYRPSSLLLTPVGVDKTNQKIWHYGMSTRVYRQEAQNKWVVVTTSFEEFSAFVNGLMVTGSEGSMRKKLLPRLTEIAKDREEKEKIRKDLEAKELKKLQKKMELEALMAMGPRRSKRAKNDTYAAFFVDPESTDNEDLAEETSQLTMEGSDANSSTSLDEDISITSSSISAHSSKENLTELVRKHANLPAPLQPVKTRSSKRLNGRVSAL